MKSSCFELFGDGKYGLFLAKKLMERWYLLGLIELSIIFQDFGNVVFRAVSISISIIYLTFLKYTPVCNFADDTTFYACDKDLRSLINRLEHDSHLKIEWFENNHI